MNAADHMLHAWAVDFADLRGGKPSDDPIIVLARNAEDAASIGLEWWRAGAGPNEDPERNMVTSVRLVAWVAIADERAEVAEVTGGITLLYDDEAEQEDDENIKGYLLS